MAKNTKEISTQVSEETLSALRQSFPMEQTAQRIMLPRITMASQDITKESGVGRNKKIEVVTAAGTFHTEVQTDAEDPETGKKIWEKTEIGDSFQGIILYQRKQLRMYDEQTEKYTSSPVYDTDEETIPLFCDGSEVARGTPSDLKAKYQYKDEKTGKLRSRLEDNRILYVKNVKDDTLYQMSLRGSSMYAFFQYGRKVLVPSVVTEFSSEPKEKGSINWNQMTFKVQRKLSQDEADGVLSEVLDIKRAIEIEKSQYVVPTRESGSDRDLVELATG